MKLVKCDDECKHNINGVCEYSELKLERSFEYLYCHNWKHNGVDQNENK